MMDWIFLKFYWSIFDLQCFVNFCWTAKCVCVCVCVCVSGPSVMPDSLWPHGQQPAKPIYRHSCCCSPVAMSCLTLCHPMDCSTPGEFGPCEHWLPIVLAFVVVHLLSRVKLLATTWTAALPGFLVLHNLPELDQTHVLWVHGAIQPSHPLLSPSPPALSFSQQQCLFQWVSTLHQVAKVSGFNFTHSNSPSNEYSELISLRVDC